MEAEYRLTRLRQADHALGREFEWDPKSEAEIVNAIIDPVENALIDFIDETPAQGLLGAAVKLREMLVVEPDNADELRQVLAVVEREAGRGEP